MGQSDYYLHGSSNAVCDRCGFKYKRRDMRKEWTGSYACYGGNTNNCWEPRNAQDFVKGRFDKQTPPWVRPETTENFVADRLNSWSNDQQWSNGRNWIRDPI